MAATELVIPDPRRETVPVGWWDDVFRPWVEAQSDWATLDGAEARIRVLLSYIEALDGDQIELRKAWRMLEVRRGELLGPRQPGARTDLQPVPHTVEVEGIPSVVLDASPASMSRWRTMADHKPDVLAALRAATEPHHVSQSAVLRRIEEAGSGPQRPPAGPVASSTAPDVIGDGLVQAIEDALMEETSWWTAGAADGARHAAVIAAAAARAYLRGRNE